MKHIVDHRVCVTRSCGARPGEAAAQGQPNMYGRTITADQAKSVAAAVAEARKNQWTMAVAIVDPAGDLVTSRRWTTRRSAASTSRSRRRARRASSGRRRRFRMRCRGRRGLAAFSRSMARSRSRADCPDRRRQDHRRTARRVEPRSRMGAHGCGGAGTPEESSGCRCDQVSLVGAALFDSWCESAFECRCDHPPLVRASVCRR